MKPRGRKKALDIEQIEDAQYLRENGLSFRAIADVFGVSRMAIWRSLIEGSV
jgi:DNA invertase Pin-like site-specific DNA recombinase